MSPRNHKSDCTAASDGKAVVPAGVPDWITAELIERTIVVWQPYYDEVLTPEVAATMIRL